MNKKLILLSSLLVLALFVISACANKEGAVGRKIVDDDISPIDDENGRGGSNGNGDIGYCGNGIIEGAEECDESFGNGDVCVPEPNGECTYCDSDCRLTTVIAGGSSNVYQVVLDMLNSCNVVKLTSIDPPENPFFDQELTCDEFCEAYEDIWGIDNLRCTGGFIKSLTSTGIKDLMKCDTPWEIGYDNQTVSGVDCICCSPPS